MAKKNVEMFQAKNPDPAKKGARVTKAHYDTYRTALLQAIPATEEGIEFMGLSKVVEGYVSAETLAQTAVGWWTTTVKLDLEARGLIERIPGKGRQRIRRIAS